MECAASVRQLLDEMSQGDRFLDSFESRGQVP